MLYPILLMFIISLSIIAYQPVYPIITQNEACRISSEAAKKAYSEWLTTGLPERLSKETEDQMVDSFVNCISYYSDSQLQQVIDNLDDVAKNFPPFAKYVFGRVIERVN
jgi:hypothetical protein